MERALERAEELFFEKLKGQINKDLRYSLFYMAPNVEREKFDWELFGQRVGLGLTEARRFRDDLLRAGLWRLDEAGVTRVLRDPISMGALSVVEFLNLSVQIFSNFSESGHCWYETFCVVTTDELKKEYLAGMNRLMADFLKKSAEAKGDTVIAWAHGSLDALKTFPAAPERPS